MADNFEALPQEVKDEILMKVKSNNQEIDGKIRDFLEKGGSNLDKNKRKEVTKTRITLLKQHISSNLQVKEEDKEKTKLLENLEKYELSKESAFDYMDEIKSFSENKNPNGSPDEKKNAAGEDPDLPIKLLKIPFIRSMFFKTLNTLNTSAGGLFQNILGKGFVESITIGVNASICFDDLKGISKKNETPDQLKGIDLDKIDAAEVKPFFTFLESAGVDPLKKDFWKDLFAGKLEAKNGAKLKLPKISSADGKIKDKLGNLDEFYDFLNAFESANPDLMKEQDKVSSGFGRTFERGKTESCYYMQYDPRWGHKMYGSKSMSASACGPTSFAMVASMLGKRQVLPPEVADWSLKNGHRLNGKGTDWSFMQDAAKEYGIGCENIGKNQNRLIEMLKAGKKIISSMGPGHFTSGGHYIVLSGIDAQTGKIIVLDPGKKSRNGLYDVDFLMTQTKNMWAYS